VDPPGRGSKPVMIITKNDQELRGNDTLKPPILGQSLIFEKSH
jgi:hypothetical protein